MFYSFNPAEGINPASVKDQIKAFSWQLSLLFAKSVTANSYLYW